MVDSTNEWSYINNCRHFVGSWKEKKIGNSDFLNFSKVSMNEIKVQQDGSFSAPAQTRTEEGKKSI